jgi:hypothetical protein
MSGRGAEKEKRVLEQERIAGVREKGLEGF